MAKKNNSEFIDINALLAEYRKHWYWFVISVVVFAILGFVATKIFKQRFAVNANVLISQDDSGMAKMGGFSDLFGSNGNVEDEVFVINSHTVLRDVVRNMNLNHVHTVNGGFLNNTFKYLDFPVEVYCAPSLTDTLSSAIVFKIKVKKGTTADIEVKNRKNTIAELTDVPLPATVKTDMGNFVVNTTKFYPKNKDVKTTVTIAGYDGAAEDLGKEITSDIASKKSNIIRLGIETTNAQYGEDVLNAIIAQYNNRGIANKNVQNEKTAAFIDQRLALISGDLSDAESDIQSYKNSNGIIDVKTEAEYNVQMKAGLDRQLIQAQTENEIIRMARDFIADPDKAYELIPAGSEIAGVGPAIATYNQMILQRMQLANNAKANNRALVQLNEQIDAMRQSINTGLNRALENSNVTLRDLHLQMNKAQGKLGNIPTQEREYLNLKRQQEVKQSLYMFLLQKREETAMMLANALPKGEIVDAAYTRSEPVGPGKKLILLAFIFIGLCVPPALLYARRLLRTRFESADEVEQITDVPMLGEVCTDTSGQTVVVSDKNTSSSAELFRLMRTRLQFILNEPGDKVVVVTSTRPGEGKSYVSINLAASMALLGQRVLLVGLDIRNPQLANYLNIRSTNGVTQYLANPDKTNIDSLIHKQPFMANLDVLPAGPIPPNPGELLASNALTSLFETLRNEYDLIVVDSAPVGMVSDTLLLASVADATVYVCRANHTTFKDIEFLNTLYSEKRLKKMSLVINGTSAKKGYGYGYHSADNGKPRRRLFGLLK